MLMLLLCTIVPCMDSFFTIIDATKYQICSFYWLKSNACYQGFQFSCLHMIHTIAAMAIIDNIAAINRKISIV